MVRHDLPHVFIASILKGRIKLDFQNNAAKFFKIPPKNIVPYQRRMFLDAKLYVKQKKIVLDGQRKPYGLADLHKNTS